MTVLDDARIAWRRLRGSPLAALAAVLMLALAVGLTTAMFSLIDTLLMRPVPFPDADRIAQVVMHGPHGGRVTVSGPVFQAWRASGVFDRVEGEWTGTFLLGSGDQTTSRDGAFVSPGLLGMLGARPVAGRLFLDDEGRAAASDRVVISEELWRGMFGADPAAIGTHLIVDGIPATIVGVLPDDFHFPEWKTMVWRPIDFLAPPADRAGLLPRAVVRIAAGVPRADAMRTATAVAHAADPSLPDDQWAWSSDLASPGDSNYISATAPVLAAAATMVFLVLCANVCGLLFARLDTRLREVGVAAALGASRSRLMREALVESGCFALSGLVLGLVLAAGFLAMARAWLPEALLAHTLNQIDLDTRAFGAASAAGLLAVILAGLLPAWYATRVSPLSVMRPAARGASEGRGGRAARRILLVAEVAFACALLAGASLLVRSFLRLAGAERGLDAGGVITVSAAGIGGEHATRAVRGAAARELEGAIRALPGVENVAFTWGLPPRGGALADETWTGEGAGGTSVDLSIQYYRVGPDFFDIYRVPLLRGRTFVPSDPDTAVIVGERMAEMLWPNVNPIGRYFRVSGWDEPHLVIGVARELHLPTTDAFRDRPEFYLPFTPGGQMVWLSIRCAPCPDLARIRQTIGRAQPDADIWQAAVLDREYLAYVEGPRAAALLVLTFATIALVAVGGGLFAVLSCSAGRRRREFGIRLALGARPGEIRALMIGEGARVVAAGALLGGLGAWWLSGLLTSVMYGISPGDPVSWLIVVASIGATCVAASWRPAARAARIDPSVLLREE